MILEPNSKYWLKIKQAAALGKLWLRAWLKTPNSFLVLAGIFFVLMILGNILAVMLLAV